jgi:hypothetical protein
MPPDGFEVREAHRDSSAPDFQANRVYNIGLVGTTDITFHEQVFQ